MNADAAKAQIKAHGFLTVTPDVSRNAIRWLDGEAGAGRLVRTADGYATKQHVRKVKK